MAIETLKGRKKIGQAEVLELDHKIPIYDFTEMSKGKYIIINHEDNTITFKIQKGAIKENGINGCQVEDMVRTAKEIVLGLNSNYPCKENEKMITCLQEAIHWSQERTRDREKRGVEGFEKD